MSTISKKEANYVDEAPNKTRYCYICTMYRVPNKCTLVRGKIAEFGICDHYDPDKRFTLEEQSKPTQITKGNQSMDTLAMFLPLTKVDAVNRLVYGIATEEKPDRTGEIFDYEKSKPYYEKWSAEISKASDGKSLGNLRAMHGRTVAGKVTELTFNDPMKRIEICAKVVDENEWQKVLEGCYTGFSQGGGYVSRVPDSANPNLKRYVADPTEISLVDLPCLPTATFQLIKSIGAVSEMEVHSFKPISDEKGVQEAFEKFQKEFGDLAFQKHAPGREMSVTDGELPSDGDKNVGEPGGSATSSTPAAPATPATDHVDPKEGNEDHGDGAGNLGIKEGEGNSEDSAGGVNSGKGSGSPGENPGNDDKGSGTPGDNPAHKDGGGSPLDAVKQVWLAKDGKPFSKKSEALAHNEKLEANELAATLASPALKAMDDLKRSLDRIDGGEVKIQDVQAFDKTWQLVVSAQSTRAGHQPLGKVYSSVQDLPPAVKEHFKDANKQRQWMHVWNNVYKDSKDEQKAFAQAWAAAEKALTSEEFEKAQAAAKPFGDIKYADPGYLKDGRKRYPLDSERNIKSAWSFLHMPKYVGKYTSSQVASMRDLIVKAWKAANLEGTPPNMSKLMGSDLIKEHGRLMAKHLYDVGDVACQILRLNDLRQCLEMEAVREGDDMGTANELRDNISSLCAFLRRLVAEETEELIAGTEDLSGSDDDDGTSIEIFVRAAVGPNASYLAKVFNDTLGVYEEAESQKALKKGLKYNKSTGILLISGLEKIGKKMGQVNRMHLQAAHDHIAAVFGGVCGDDGMDKAGASLSKDTKDHLQKIHDGMSDLGADCSMEKAVLLRSTNEEISTFEKSRGLGEGALRKVVDENIALKKALNNVVEVIPALKERIEKLEREPEPPKGVKRIVPGVIVLNKGQDSGDADTFVYNGERGQTALDQYAKHLETLPEEQRTLELIKLAQRNPRVQLP